MATTTARGGLIKPSDGEAADIVVINANMDKISDYAMGPFVCTSTTKPASPYNGQMIKETDTKNVYQYDTATAYWEYISGPGVPVAITWGAYTPSAIEDPFRIMKKGKRYEAVGTISNTAIIASWNINVQYTAGTITNAADRPVANKSAHSPAVINVAGVGFYFAQFWVMTDGRVMWQPAASYTTPSVPVGNWSFAMPITSWDI